MEIIERKILPSTTRSCHASTVEFFNGYPVFSWFGGSSEGRPDVSIYLYNLNNKGKILELYHDNIPHWNPILYSTEEIDKNQLFLFDKDGIFCDRWQTHIHNVTNWDYLIPKKEIRAKRKTLPAGLNGPVKTRPLYVPETDTVLCGSSVETMFDWTSYIEEYEFKNNEFVFKNRSNPLNVKNKYKYEYYGKTLMSLGIIQPALWKDSEYIYSFFRSSHGLNKIYFSKSKIGSGVWDLPVATNFSNPNSGIDVVHYKDRLFLVHNPSQTNRYPLVISEIKMYNYNIKIVKSIIVREKSEDNAVSLTNELSYPYMIENNGKLHLTYTVGRANIEYCIIDID
jgi:predicted neuraminidase